MGLSLRIAGLNAWYGPHHAVKDVWLELPAHTVTAVIGPSGCGKSTFLRCLNRLHELAPGARVSGQVWVGPTDIYAPEVDPITVRRRVGMVFQQPNVFPTLSIFDNVAAGLKLAGVRDRRLLAERVEQSLRQAALWDEVKDRLRQPAVTLSGGQQQRLCIARALAVEPSVLLLDEPTSALDPASTARIEELLLELKERYTVVIVTHNLQQATRVSDYTAFFLLGELVECGETAQVFTAPRDQRTEAYVTGQFG